MIAKYFNIEDGTTSQEMSKIFSTLILNIPSFVSNGKL
jgi:hypothetical protein